MEQRKRAHVFTFESEYTLPYTQSDLAPEPEKELWWYARAANACYAISGYAKNLILSFFKKKEPEKIVDDDSEEGRRSPKSPLRAMQKETWTYGPTM